MHQQIITTRAIPGLDQITHVLAKGLGKVLHWLTGRHTIRGAGVFWIAGGAPFVDAWREPGAWTLHVGRVELQVDLIA